MRTQGKTRVLARVGQADAQGTTRVLARVGWAGVMNAIGVLMLATMTAGCVGSGKYEEAVTAADEANAKADKLQTQKNALEQEIKNLRDQKAKLTADSELASSELQRLKDSLDKERGGTDSRVRKLDQQSRDLAARSRALQQELDSLRKQNSELKATVARYQKALKEPPKSLVPDVPAAPAVPAVPIPAVPATPAIPATPPAPSVGLSPVNLNSASANDMVLFLGLTKDQADKVVANRPYKVKGELLAKSVIPKATYDAIKDRISVVP